jgi:integrase
LVQRRKPGKFGDGLGLILQISKRGTASWLFRYSHGGKSRHHGLGSALTFNLAEAREIARARRQEVLAGRDPIGQRAGGKAMTFERAFREFWATRKLQIDAKTRTNRESAMIRYAMPILGHLRVDAIGQADVLRVLEPAWLEKARSLSKLRGLIEATLDWAIGKGYRADANPAQWRLIGKVLPSPAKVAKVENHKALPFGELPTFMQALRAAQDTNLPMLALHFTILTAVRSGDVLGLRWCDLDLDKADWKIAKTKTGRPHVVALCEAAVALLREVEAMKLPGARVFAVGKDAMRLALGTLWPDGTTVHGFRSSFRDWASATWVRQAVVRGVADPDRVVEEALAHDQKGSKVELAYRRTDFLADRRDLMDAWGSFATSEPGEVVPMPVKAVA